MIAVNTAWLWVVAVTSPVQALGLSQLFGDKGSASASTDMILCTVRHSVKYATVYDTVLVNKVSALYHVGILDVRYLHCPLTIYLMHSVIQPRHHLKVAPESNAPPKWRL